MCCWGFLRRIIPFRRRKRRGQKSDTFLTPFEIEVVPSLLRELHATNIRFYEVVCYRWHKEASNLVPGDDKSKVFLKKSCISLMFELSNFL